MNDPVVGLDDAGQAWIVGLGVCDTSCAQQAGSTVCPGTFARAYSASTSDGATFSAPAYLPDAINPCSGVDHPSIAVERRAGLADVLHIVYRNNYDYAPTCTLVNGSCVATNGGECDEDIVYLRQTVGGGWILSSQLDVLPGGGEVGASSPLIDLAAGASAEVAWFGGDDSSQDPMNGDVYVCDVLWPSCDLGPQLLSGLDPALKIDRDQLSTQNGAICDLDNSSGWDIAASPTNANIMYYVYNARETDGGVALNCQAAPAVACNCPGFYNTPGTNCNASASNPQIGDGNDLDCQQEKDIMFSVLTFSPVSGWTRSPPVHVGPTNDDFDQAVPTVTVHARSATADSIFVSWYDRRDACPDGTLNSCFRVHGAWSDDGLNFYDDRRIDAGLSDSRLLVQPCQIAGFQFKVWLGDYHDAVGDALHVPELFTTAPTGGPAGSGNLEGAWESRGFRSW